MAQTDPSGPVINLPPDLEPFYANLVRISHTPMEMTLDFACMLPGQNPTDVISRVLMSPLGAKLFLRALAENLARYEAAFGEVRVPGDSNLASDLFRGVTPPGS